MFVVFFFSSRRRHTRYIGDWSSDVCSSDLRPQARLTVNVTSNRAWGLQLTSDRSDGRSRQWNGSSYGALGLANPMQWQIGRASCRERVESAVAAVSLEEREDGRGGGE